MKWLIRICLGITLLFGAFVGVKFSQYQSAMEDVRSRLPGGSRLVQTSAGEVEYSIQGDSESFVLLIHGTPGSHHTFMAEKLVEEGFTVISPSRPGYFRTPLSSGETIAEQADLYVSLLDALGIESADIIGFSGGGPSALAFASRHPQRCTGLVVMASMARPLPSPPPSPVMDWVMGSGFGRWMAYTTLSASFEGDASEAANEYVANAFFPLASVIEGEQNDVAQLESDWNANLAAISSPTLIIHGTNDELIPFSEAKLLEAEINNATLLSKQGQDHFTVVFFEFAENLETSAEFLNAN